MKRLLFVIALAASLTAIAAPKVSNKDACLAVSKAIAAAELGVKVDALLAKDFKYHGPAGMELETPGYVGFMAQLNASFSDMKMTFTHVVEEGDLVAVHYTNTFIFKNAYNGLPPTGKPVTMTGTFVRKVKNGKVVEEWDNPDLLGLMQQIGAIPPPPAAQH
jgi:predicted ester cyclase